MEEARARFEPSDAVLAFAKGATGERESFRTRGQPRHRRAPEPVLVGWSRGWSLWWEEAWPLLWVPIGPRPRVSHPVLARLWLDLSAVRLLGLGLFAGALSLSLWPILRLRMPRPERPRPARPGCRPEHWSGPRARRQPGARGSPIGTRALWELHRKRAEEAVEPTRVGRRRSPGMPRRDRFALRAAGVLAVVTSAFVAGPEIDPPRSGLRLARAGGGRASFRVDGWIDPPLYTRMPPLMIDLAAVAAPPGAGQVDRGHPRRRRRGRRRSRRAAASPHRCRRPASAPTCARSASRSKDSRRPFGPHGLRRVACA